MKSRKNYIFFQINNTLELQDRLDSIGLTI